MNNIYFWLLSLGHFLVDFYGNFLPALLPVMVKSLDINMALSGLIITSASMAAHLMQVPAGYVFDQRPVRFWLPITILVSGIFICTAGLMPSYALFLLFPVISGLGTGFYHPAASAYTYNLADTNRGFRVSIFASFGSLGFAIAPMVAGFFLHYGDRMALLWLIIPGILLAAVVGFTNLNHLHPARQNAQTAGKSGLREISTNFLLLALVMTLRAWGLLAIANFPPFLLENWG